MSDFEEEFEIPATSEVDPAAEFLAKEQVNKILVLILHQIKAYWLLRPRQSLWSFSLCISSLQAELGDIGEDLGIAPAASQSVPELADNDNFLTEGEVR